MPFVIGNEARAMRIMEIMNDFRTLHLHINAHIARLPSSPPDQQSFYAEGFVVLRQCDTEARAIMARHFNQGNLGFEPGRIDESEVQRATLQR